MPRPRKRPPDQKRGFTTLDTCKAPSRDAVLKVLCAALGTTDASIWPPALIADLVRATGLAACGLAPRNTPEYASVRNPDGPRIRKDQVAAWVLEILITDTMRAFDKAGIKVGFTTHPDGRQNIQARGARVVTGLARLADLDPPVRLDTRLARAKKIACSTI
jgi:hypothetical protein